MTDRDLFGDPIRLDVGPAQGSLFGELEGTKLAQTEALKLANADGPITAEEMTKRRDELGRAKNA